VHGLVVADPNRTNYAVIDALRARERDGAIDLPTKHGRARPKVGDRVRVISGPFVGHSGLCTSATHPQLHGLYEQYQEDTGDR
jgi:transcription antitermination factor NusG